MVISIHDHERKKFLLAIKSLDHCKEASLFIKFYFLLTSSPQLLFESRAESRDRDIFRNMYANNQIFKLILIELIVRGSMTLPRKFVA